MKHFTRIATLYLLLVGFTIQLGAQTPVKPTASEIYQSLQKLNFLGSALYIAAHPDDENTRLISYLSNDVKARTAYLSLTRGDGGQNLIGPELRELLGVIRTQELLAARRTDGGQQFFTRANDFGYSKNPEETLEIWNKKEVLGDVVRIIRMFKPDIIINRFNHRTPGSTHGHHTSSAMLSVEAYDLVNDTSKYPKTANEFGTWQPKRLFFNTSWWFYGSRENFEKADKSNLVTVETGTYYPNLGMSNGEIASLSRSMHKSQGFGSTGTRGTQKEYLELLKGSLPTDKTNLFEGIDTSWSRIEGGKEVGNILYAVEENFNFKDPAQHVPQLVEAYKILEGLPEGYWKSIKLKELAELIAQCSGLFLEATASESSAVPGEQLIISIEAINRSNKSIYLHSITSPIVTFPSYFAPIPLKNNERFEVNSVENTFNVNSFSTPYWLEKEGTMGMYRVSDESLIGQPERPNPFPVTFQLTIEGIPISITKNIVYKYNDPVKGEVYQPFEVLPIVTASLPEKVSIFPSTESKELQVTVRSGRDQISGTVSLQHPEGWSVSPSQHTFTLERKGSTKTLIFSVTPPNEQAEGYVSPLIQVGDVFSDKELFVIDYEHLPLQKVLLPAQTKVVRIPIEKKGDRIGYIEGAGDAIPESLRHIGYTVTNLDPASLKVEDLQEFDAVVVGIRAYNTVPEMAFKQSALNQYVANGGTVVVQYNTSRGLVSQSYGPYPLTLSRDRVTNEFSPVQLLAKDHPVLNRPNKISQKDFDNWVQERGLYFPNQWDEAYIPILEMNDPGEAPTKGSLLVASHGKGYYVYTGLSFFRELPAGVAGAYRLFANLLSLGN